MSTSNKKIFLFSLILCFISLSHQKIDKNKVVVAINCGGEEYTDQNGIIYEADRYYDKGKESDHGMNYDISGTDDVDLYQTERWSSETLTYSLPLQSPGKYVLVLKFSEVYFNNANEKVFDIALGKDYVIRNLDIYAKVGKAAASDEYVEFELKNGKVYYQGKELRNAYNSDNKTLQLKFLKGAKDNPKINAILMIKGSIKDTDYDEKKKKMDLISKQKNDEAKKKLTIDLRHHSDEEYQENDLLTKDLSELIVSEDTSIISIFATNQGIGIVASLGVFFVLNKIIDLI